MRSVVTSTLFIRSRNNDGKIRSEDEWRKNAYYDAQMNFLMFIFAVISSVIVARTPTAAAVAPL